MRRILLVTTMLATGFISHGSYAASEDEMMAKLKAMQLQMNQMQQEMAKLQKELAETKAQTKTANKVTEEIKAAKANPQNDVKITMSPAPKIETADGNYSFKIGGFGQIDGGIFDDDKRDRPDGTNVRRARLNVSGVIAKDFKYKLENDFAGNASNITDAFIEYTAFDPLSIMVGQFKEPFGLETLTSDLFTTFIERASTVAFSPERKIGVQLSAYGNVDGVGNWTAALGGFGAGTGTTTSTDDEARDVTARLTFAPVADKTEVLHFGVAGSHRVPDNATDSFSFSSRAENQMSSASADLSVNTGTISSVDSVDLLGLEAAGVYGPFSLQGEYVLANVNRRAGLAEPSYKGYYVEGSYFLTGESRAYLPKQAKFDRVTPKWNFDPKKGNWGAWQIATRYSVLDLNDSGVNGGEMKNTTFGLRWIPHPNFSLTANYIMSNTDGNSVTANDDPNIWLLRAQYDF